MMFNIGEKKIGALIFRHMSFIYLPPHQRHESHRAATGALIGQPLFLSCVEDMKCLSCQLCRIIHTSQLNTLLIYPAG